MRTPSDSTMQPATRATASSRDRAQRERARAAAQQADWLGGQVCGGPGEQLAWAGGLAGWRLHGSKQLAMLPAGNAPTAILDGSMPLPCSPASASAGGAAGRGCRGWCAWLGGRRRGVAVASLPGSVLGQAQVGFVGQGAATWLEPCRTADEGVQGKDAACGKGEADSPGCR